MDIRHPGVQVEACMYMLRYRTCDVWRSLTHADDRPPQHPRESSVDAAHTHTHTTRGQAGPMRVCAHACCLPAGPVTHSAWMVHPSHSGGPTQQTTQPTRSPQQQRNAVWSSDQACSYPARCAVLRSSKIQAQSAPPPETSLAVRIDFTHVFEAFISRFVQSNRQPITHFSSRSRSAPEPGFHSHTEHSRCDRGSPTDGPFHEFHQVPCLHA